MRALKLRPGVD